MASRMVNIFQSLFNCVTRVDARLDVFLGKSRQFSTIWQYYSGVFLFSFYHLSCTASPLENSVDFELDMSYHVD